MFPIASGMVDEFREAFGEGVKVMYLSEGGKTMGKLSNSEPLRGRNPRGSKPVEEMTKEQTPRDANEATIGAVASTAELGVKL